MSAYRDKPRPPAYRVVFRRPLGQRLRDAAGIGLFAALALFSVAGFLVAVTRGAGIAFGIPCLMVLGTSIAFLTITWSVNRPERLEGTIQYLRPEPEDPTHCTVWVDGQPWMLPLSENALREGEEIQVRFRVVGPRDEPEVVEVRVAAEG